jgi:SAM-dependent methyltransferase
MNGRRTKRSNRRWQDAYLHRFYDPAEGFVDGTTEFLFLCQRNIVKGGRIVEIGAGPSNGTSRYLAELGELHGVDVDPAVRSNDALTSAEVIAPGDALPYPEAHFDACVSDFVLEHVSDPVRHLSEVRRVLKPGGVYVLRTPNVWHYVSLGARLTPHWFHQLVANRIRGLRANAHEPYRTFHRLNSRRRLTRTALRSGFDVHELRMIEKEPSYGMSSRVLFLLFMAYERLANSSSLLAGLRANILAVLRRAAP